MTALRQAAASRLYEELRALPVDDLYRRARISSPRGKPYGAPRYGRSALIATIIERELVSPPRFVMVAPGDYEALGMFRLRKLDGGKTQAWNVEWTTSFEYENAYNDLLPGYPVDGARTKADALALFADWWARQ